MPLRLDNEGRRWGSFTAEKQNEQLQVYERIYADDGSGWPDVSSWYWATVGARAAGPWWAVTIAEREKSD